MSKLTKSSLLLLLLVSCADAQAEQGDFLDRIKNFFGLSQEEADQNKDENPALEESGYPIGGAVTSSTKISEGGHLDGYWRGGITEDKSSFHQDQSFAEEPVEGSSVAPGQYPQSDLSIAPEMMPRAETSPLPALEESGYPIGGEVTSSTKISEGGHLDGYWRGGRTEDKSSFHQDQPFAEEPVEGSSVAPGQYPQSNLSIAPEMIPRTETPPLPEVPQSIQPAVPPSLMPEESP